MSIQEDAHEFLNALLTSCGASNWNYANNIVYNNSSSNSDNSNGNIDEETRKTIKNGDNSNSISNNNNSFSSSKSMSNNVDIKCSICSTESTCRCLKNKSGVYSNEGAFIQDSLKNGINDDDVEVIIDDSTENGNIDGETRKSVKNGDFVVNLESTTGNGTNVNLHKNSSKLSVNTDFTNEIGMNGNSMKIDSDDVQFISNNIITGSSSNLVNSDIVSDGILDTDLNNDRNTYLTDLFLGSLENTVQCLECGHLSRKYESGIYIYIHTYMYVCIYIYLYIDGFVYIHVCTCTFIHICVYMYLHIKYKCIHIHAREYYIRIFFLI
jgi:hypothetical protein